MSRPLRLEFTGALYHVSSRDNDESLSVVMNLILSLSLKFLVIFVTVTIE
ncbi:hypothetical protein [Pseudoalteromonas phenolica]|nr:hypothetical protein [Pseudoalteromonas phenolica]